MKIVFLIKFMLRFKKNTSTGSKAVLHLCPMVMSFFFNGLGVLVSMASNH